MPEQVGDPPPPSWWRRRRLDVALFGLIFVVGCVSPTPQVGDSRLSVVTAWQFLTHGNLQLQGYRSVTRLTDTYDLVRYHGHLLPYFPWPTMLFMIPADLVFAVIGHHPGLLSISDPNRTWILEVPTASLLVAGTALAVRRAVLDLGAPWGTRRTSVVAALVYAFATSAWSIGSRALWQQTVSMLCLMLVLVSLRRVIPSRASEGVADMASPTAHPSRWALLLGGALVVAVISRPTNAVMVVLVVALVAWRRPRRLIEMLAVGVVLMVPFLLISHSQYGTFLPPYYLPGRLGEPGPLSLPNALAANLVSPGRGLVLFDPVVLLAAAGVWLRIRRRRRRLDELDVFMVLSVVGLWLTISVYGSTGGATYGPRLMLDVVPYLVVLAAPCLKAACDPPPWHRYAGSAPTPSGAHLALGITTLVLLAWGLWVNATGGLLRSAYCWSAEPVPIDSQPSRVWDWSDPQFLAPYEDLAHGASAHEVISASCGTLKPYVASVSSSAARTAAGRSAARGETTTAAGGTRATRATRSASTATMAEQRG